jgi:tetratricopeptide (TPR) repeat protein
MKFPVSYVWNLLLIALLASVTGCSRDARRDRHLAQAEKYFAAGQYSPAEIEYLNVFKLDHANAHAIGRLGIIYFDEGRLSRAYPFLTRANELDPANLEVRTKLAGIELLAGASRDARVQLNYILDRQPTNSEAIRLLADSARSRNDVDETRRRLDALRHQTGELPALNIAAGTLFIREGDFKQAEAQFRHAMELSPANADAHFALGKLFWLQNNLTNADAEFKIAADRSPPRSIHRVDYASFKIQIGQPAEAGKILTAMTRETPDDLLPWLGLAEISLAQRQFSNSQVYLEQAIVRDPDNHDTLLLDSQLKVAQGRLDEAATELDRLASHFDHSPRVRYQAAVVALLKSDVGKAMKNLSEAILLDPAYDDAILLQAQLNIRRDNVPAAIAALKDLIRRRPMLAQAQLLLAAAYIAREDYNNALATYRHLAQLFPQNPQVPLLTGGVLQQIGRNDDARAAYAQCLKLAPHAIGPIEQLVNLDLSEKKLDAALARVQDELTNAPSAPALLLLRARVLLAKKDPGTAERSLKQAIAADPNFVPPYLLLAQLYAESHRETQALGELSDILLKKTNEVPALLLMGMIQSRQQNDAAARATYERLLAINPNSSPALNNLAYLYSEKFHELDKAYAAARKARDLAPSDPNTADTLGWVLYQRGNYPWALSLLQESAEKLFGEPEVLFHLGMTYYALDDETRAQTAFKRALALNRDFPGKDQAAQNLAVLAIDPSARDPKAAAALEARLRDHPDDPVALSRLAVIYDRQGAPEKAAANYERALRSNPKNARLLLALARLNAGDLHNPGKALDLAKQAYTLAPDDPDVSHELGRLAYVTGDHPWAVNLLQQAAAKQPGEPALAYDLALAYYSVGRIGDAETALGTALADPAFPHAREARQFLDMITPPTDEPKALQQEIAARKILTAQSNNVPALMVIAAAADKRGDARTAATALKVALQFAPEFTPARKQLALLDAEKLGDDKAAYDLAVQARKDLPNDPDLARVLGVIQYRRGDYESAARFLADSSRNGSSDAGTYYYLGMARYKLKQPKESRAALQRALALNLPTGLATEAHRVLAELK